MSPTLAEFVQRAVAAGALPPDAGDAPAAPAGRPWPMVLLIGLGAWLVALPLIGVFALALGEALTKGGTPYVIGPMVLVLATLVLRIRGVPLFIEQLAVPALLVGAGALCFGVFRDLHWASGAALTMLVALLLAAALPQAWLRALLGALAAQLCVVAIGPAQPFDHDGLSIDILALIAVLVIGLAAFAAQRACGRRPGRALAVAAWLEAVGCGWMLALLADLAWSAGETFLVGGSLRSTGFASDLMHELQRGAGSATSLWPGALSALQSLAAAAWAARLWPGLRRAPLAIAAALLVLLSARLPLLGSALLLLSLMLTTGRKLRAGAAALVAAWIIGSVYYQLDWPLATKALGLAGIGIVFGLMASWLWRADRASARARAGATRPPRAATIGIGLALLATLAVVNFGIAQNERLIAQGRPVFIALRPVDPRSLMQGDFMRLNFSVDESMVPASEGGLRSGSPRVVLGLDARGIATVRRAEQPGQPLAADELLVQLSPKAGRWTIVTDGWFFEEGEAERFSRARFGEFRIDAAGKALLVGLADEGLKPLH